MAQPTFFAEGTASRRADTRLRIWKKILGVQQNAGGALAANNPRATDTLRVTRQKFLNALNGTSYTG